MQQTEIDRVPVLWEQGPEPLTAALVFGVGARHETFRTVGVTHLVEHLVMGALPKSALDRNAQVDLLSTAFHATGRPDDVVEFIHQVCAAISELPLDRLELEAGVLKAEGGAPEPPPVAVALVRRYGYRAQGLAGSTGAGIDQVTREQVVEHARRHFTSANAVLVLSGPPPEGLRLTLPAGEAVPLPVAPHLPLDLPGHDHASLDGVSLSGLVDSEPGVAGLLLAVLVDRVTEDLRTNRGIAYEIDGALAPIDVGQNLLTLWTDGHEDRLGDIATAVWATVGRVAADGPTDEELDHARSLAAADLDDPRAVTGWLHGQALRILVGEPVRTRSDYVELLRAVSPEQVRLAAEQVRDTAVLLVPDTGDVEPDQLQHTDPEPTDDPVIGDTVFKRRLASFAPRDLRVSIGTSGISMRVQGAVSSAAWDDVAGVAHAPGMRAVLLVDGRMMPLLAKHLHDSETLFRRIDELSGHLAFHDDPERILG